MVSRLQDHGGKGDVLRRPTEQILLDNWAHILYENNKGNRRLNGCPLTQGEMQQILKQVAKLRTPMRLNGFINGGPSPSPATTPMTSRTSTAR